MVIAAFSYNSPKAKTIDQRIDKCRDVDAAWEKGSESHFLPYSAALHSLSERAAHNDCSRFSPASFELDLVPTGVEPNPVAMLFLE